MFSIFRGKVLSIFRWVSGDNMFIESFEWRSLDEWVDLIKTLNREKLEPGAVSCRNWQSRKLGFREPELTRRVESLYLIVRAGDGRERSTVDREQTSYGADISSVNSGALIRALSLAALLSVSLQ